MKKKYFIFFAACLGSVPFLFWGAWLVTPKKKLVVAIVDKTEFERSGRQHLGLTWVLNNEKYSKTHKKLYDAATDYFGFYPKGKSEYKIKGLERFSSAQLEALSNDCDATYYVDSYGVYHSDLRVDNAINKGTGIIYGGMSQNDIDFLKKIKNRHKLIISEFNILEAPTPPAIRKQFETEFGLTWSGWACRYFDSFDPSENKEIPRWLINSYKVKNGGNWPFKKAGLAFVNAAGNVVILEDMVDLKDPLPFIITNKSTHNRSELPENIKFPFWFDIVTPDTAINKVAATFNLDLTDNGKSQLIKNGIPLSMPAIIQHEGSDYQFYYFAGNFCAINTLGISSSHYKWISAFKNFLYNTDDTMESTSFFWEFYKPLMTGIFEKYYAKTSGQRGK
ncbi:MAG: hypothetical protein M3040_07615 [Bacteroidota bacterium]|nr:hypothetical protein [Bacteroidota bacterium]